MNILARVVDTDVLSFVFKKDSRAEAYRPELDGYHLLVSFQSVAELWHWAEVAKWGERRRGQLALFLTTFVVVHSSLDLCRHWALAMSQARAQGRPILSADAWVGATALYLQLPLVTNNAADFQGLVGLDLIECK